MSEPESRGFFRQVHDELLNLGSVDATLKLSALLAMLYAVGPKAPQVAVGLMLGGVLFSQRLLRSRRWWLVIALLTFATAAVNWYRSDNHKWLWSYWLLACAIAANQPEERARRILAHNGRLLLGLCMAYATLWKIIGGQYFDGSFMMFELHFDKRFTGLTHLLGQSRHTMAINMNHYKSLYSSLDSASAAHTQGMYIFALAACWWTLFIEALWSWAFLVPRPHWLYERRDIVLLVFVGTTYFLAPVHGFGSLLVVMGVAQCPPERRKTLTGYLAALAILHLANPWVKTIWNSSPTHWYGMLLGA